MKIVEKKIDELIPYENNPRINEYGINALAESIKRFGFKVPVVIDSENVIVCGHTRILACEKLGIEKVPCIVADDLTPEQIKMFRLADNKTAELSTWDFEKLEKELSEIKFDMSLFEFDEKELSKEFDKLKTVEEDDFDVDKAFEETIEPKVKRGQVWKLGNHYLMCGDATSNEDVAKLMDGKKADLLITDPPYNVDYQGKTKEQLKIQNDKMDSENFNLFLTDSFRNAFDSLKAGASFYIWYANLKHINFESAINNNNQIVRQVLIWNKSGIVLGRQDYQWKHEPCLYGWKNGENHNWYADRKQSTILEFDKPNKSELHPTMKPVNLIAYLIKNSSKENDVVLDLFGGSGTTLIACESLNRKCRMLELDEKYCDVIIQRYEELTGNKAELVK